MLKVHHIGIVVRNIEKYLKSSPYDKSTDIVYDPIQQSNIVMLNTGQSGSSIELIEPMNKRSMTYSFLEKNGNSVHHICYLAKDMDEVDRYIRKYKFKKILGPVEARVFDGQSVVFAYSANQGLIEFVTTNRVKNETL
jgi:methylmalonyl-CoA/ethylmalonyl-CoA epimerase